MTHRLSRDEFDALEEVNRMAKSAKPSACVARNAKHLCGIKFLVHRKDNSYALTDKGTGTPSKIDNMSDECIDKGYNLEFILVRSAAAPAGTTISAACELSENKKRDCPKL